MTGFLGSLLQVCCVLGALHAAADAQTGVCYVGVSRQGSFTVYRQTSFGDDYSCGWFGWRRCRRTRYRSIGSVSYRALYSSQFGCCTGYQQSGSSCNPVCSGGCRNGGVCRAPNTCACTSGWTGVNCHVDVNECASSSTNNCGQVCNNNDGSYTCSCRTGYRLNSDGRTCADIDECREGTDRCEHNCMNTVGSYTCSCRTGYTLQSNRLSCTNDNECVLGTARCTHICHDTPGSYTCSCRTGYALAADGFTCRDIDECAADTDNCEHLCANTEGSFTCSCRTGYTLSTNGYSCINDNECLLGTALCVHNCHDNPGSYTCSCRAGYALNADGFSCSDIDECALMTDTCEQNCHNTVGSFTCSCNTGYTLNPNGRTCDDINECASPSHGCEHECVNFPGSYRCVCRTGYRLDADQRGCSDIDECVEDSDNCEHICHNNIGSFTCTCRPGSTLDSNGYLCNDIDECSHPDLNNCQQVCANTDGSFFCECNSGYALDSVDQITCSDIDECEVGSASCTQNCQNTIGSYTCSCNDGYTLNADSATCDDVDECVLEMDQCVDICINIPGSYNCSCRTGYGLTSDGYNCSDIDECALDVDLCDQDCSNTVGSYTCSCRTGFIIDENGYTCDDIDECGGDHMCEVACNNTAGSFHCACLTGYVLNSGGRTCRDLDECAEDVDRCDQDCSNTVGSYTCSCGDGYILNFDGFRCDDINECVAGGIGNSTCEEVCVNTPGSWHCDCFPGYTVQANGITCRDEDECTEGVNQCDQMCHNTVGSYTCSCNASTVLNSDGYRCDDIDECAMGMDSCAEVCVNTYGSFHCSCNPGYTINPDGITCRDIDECLADADLCEQLCTNTIGSYNCSCMSGYSLTANMLSCLGPPEDISLSAVDSTFMVLTWGLPQNDSSDGVVLQYVVDCASEFDQRFSLDLTRAASEERSAVLQSLLPFTEYTCCVMVETSMGGSPFGCVEETTLEEEPSTPPENVTINNDATDQLRFNFRPPVVSNGLITAYTFYITFENGSSIVIVDSEATGTFTLNGLLPYELVTVEVSANTSAGESPKSAVDEIRTAQAAPSSPTAMVVDISSNTSLTVAWDPPALSNGILQNYTVRIYNQLNQYSREFELSPTDPRFVSVDDLEPFVPYTVEVTASTVAGEGEANRVTIFTEHGVPNIPTITDVVRLSDEAARLFWQPLTPDEARGVLTLLQIAYQPAVGGVCAEIDEDAMQVMSIDENIDMQSQADIFGLDGSLEYCMAIKVSSSAGESGFTSTIKAPFSSDVYVQIRLKLANEDCETYIDENYFQKSTDISSAIVQTLLRVCSCQYSVEHVTHTRFLCGSNPNEAIFLANLLNTDGRTAAELKDLVQAWVDNAPVISVANSLQQVDPYCQVDVTQVGNADECMALVPTISTTPKRIESTEQASVSSQRVGIIAGSVGGGVVVIIIMVVIVMTLCATSRKSTTALKEKITFNSVRKADNDDITELLDHQNIGTMPRGRQRAILNPTPADYDEVEKIDFHNPLYNVPEEVAEEVEAGNGDNDDIKVDLSDSFEDSDDYVEMN